MMSFVAVLANVPRQIRPPSRRLNFIDPVCSHRAYGALPCAKSSSARSRLTICPPVSRCCRSPNPGHLSEMCSVIVSLESLPSCRPSWSGASGRGHRRQHCRLRGVRATGSRAPRSVSCGRGCQPCPNPLDIRGATLIGRATHQTYTLGHLVLAAGNGDNEGT